MPHNKVPSAKSKRAQIKNKLAPLKAKKRRGEVLTAEEQRIWDSATRSMGRVNREIRQSTYDSKSGASLRNTGPSIRQGAAGGVSSVVNGGAPGLGKRS